MTSLQQELTRWQPGHPLPAPLEQEAFRLFSVAHPQSAWGDPACSTTRNTYRAAVVALVHTLAIHEWSVQGALDTLTAGALRLMWGTRPVGPALEGEVRGYCEDFLADLSRAFLRRNVYPREVEQNIVERTAADRVVG